MTNFERITKDTMELAKILEKTMNVVDGCYNCPAKDFCGSEESEQYATCRGTLKAWLESEVEEGLKKC